MLKKMILIALVWLWTPVAVATTITIEPDDYLTGTNLSSVSPYVSIDTTGGAPVYAAPIAETLPPQISDTGPFKERVFSRSPDINSEWWSWPEDRGVNLDPYNPSEWEKDPQGLRLSFNVPVDYVSILGLELNEDAAWGFSDPIRWSVYDSSNALVFSDLLDTPLGTPGTGFLSDDTSSGLFFTYWEMQFSHPDIRTVIIGGESEPTTLDRLVFNAKPVPEPSTISLFAVGVFSSAIFCRRKFFLR